MVISLEKEWTGFRFIAVQCSTGWTGDLHIIVIHLAVTKNCNAPANQRDVERRPPAETQFSARGRRVVAVDSTHLVVGLRPALRSHLNFVAAAEIDPAVPVLRTVHFNVKLEILELCGGLQICRPGAALPFTSGLSLTSSPSRAIHLLLLTLPIGSHPLRSLPLNKL